MRGLILPYGGQWRKWRKVFLSIICIIQLYLTHGTYIIHSGFRLRQAVKYKDIQPLESKVAMLQIVDVPKHYERHIQRYPASVVTSVTYGRRVQSVDEWIVVENNKSMDGKLLTFFLDVPNSL